MAAVSSVILHAESDSVVTQQIVICVPRMSNHLICYGDALMNSLVLSGDAARSKTVALASHFVGFLMLNLRVTKSFTLTLSFNRRNFRFVWPGIL
jgi:hypothetical protein